MSDLKTMNRLLKIQNRFYWVGWILVFGGIIGFALGLYLSMVIGWPAFGAGLISGGIYFGVKILADWLMFRDLDD